MSKKKISQSFLYGFPTIDSHLFGKLILATCHTFADTKLVVFWTVWFLVYDVLCCCAGEMLIFIEAFCLPRCWTFCDSHALIWGNYSRPHSCLRLVLFLCKWISEKKKVCGALRKKQHPHYIGVSVVFFVRAWDSFTLFVQHHSFWQAALWVPPLVPAWPPKRHDV